MILNINGKDYELKYTFRTLKKLSLSGLDPFRDIDEIARTVPNIIKAFHCGLLAENNKMTEAMAENLMDAYVAEGNSVLEDLAPLIGKAILESIGMSADDALENNKENDTQENEEGK